MAIDTRAAAEVMRLVAPKITGRADWKQIADLIWRKVQKAENPDPEYIAEQVLAHLGDDGTAH